MGSVVSLGAGALGFDANHVLTGAYAACANSNYGKTFVGRYISLTSPEASGDLSSAEAVQLTENGLAILVVQHCYSAPRFPNYATQGTTDATTALSNLNAMAAPSGLFVYCDIENFDTAAHAASYATAWANKINGTGTHKAGYYGPPNVLSLIPSGTFHGLWESTGEGTLPGANISQSGGTPLSCNTGIPIDSDVMKTSLGGFWGF